MATFLMLFLMFVSVLLIAVILLQRGRGGGLVGALSGLGGQSAFGTKAGDMFTRITIGIAAVWVVFAGISGQVLRKSTEKFQGDDQPAIKSRDTAAESGTSNRPDNATEKPFDTKPDDSQPATQPATDKTDSGAAKSDSKSSVKSQTDSKSGAPTPDSKSSDGQASDKPAPKSDGETNEKSQTNEKSSEKPNESQ